MEADFHKPTKNIWKIKVQATLAPIKVSKLKHAFDVVPQKSCWPRLILKNTTQVFVLANKNCLFATKNSPE